MLGKTQIFETEDPSKRLRLTPKSKENEGVYKMFFIAQKI